MERIEILTDDSNFYLSLIAKKHYNILDFPITLCMSSKHSKTECEFRISVKELDTLLEQLIKFRVLNEQFNIPHNDRGD